MRVLGTLLVGILLAAFIVALGLFVVQNPQVGSVSFMGNSVRSNLGSLAAGAVALGFLAALVLVLPGRLTSGLRAGAFRRRAGQLESELSVLRQRYAQLEADHHRLLDEHRQLVTGTDAERPRGPAAPAPFVAMADASHSSRPGPIVPYPPQRRATSAAGAASTPAAGLRAQYRRLRTRLQQQYHALAARLRASYDRLTKRLRRRQDKADDRTRMPQGPASPAA